MFKLLSESVSQSKPVGRVKKKKTKRQKKEVFQISLLKPFQIDAPVLENCIGNASGERIPEECKAFVQGGRWLHGISISRSIPTYFRASA